MLNRISGIAHKNLWGCDVNDYSNPYFDDIDANQPFLYSRDFTRDKNNKSINSYSCDIKIDYTIKK